VSELSTPKAAQRNIVKTAVAVGWMYGGRGVGLLWTLALISQLSVGDYGLYGMGFALASILGTPLDNPFSVRAARESQERFLAERATRYLLGLTLMVAGALLVNVNYIAWFGLFVAGGEIMYKVYQSQAFRDGHPERVYRIDTIQRVTGVALACAYLFAADHPNLKAASLLYCVPYALTALAVTVPALRHRPGWPGPPRLIAVLVGETLGLAAYLQGDVLLLGFLTNHTTVGYYTITVVFAAALATVGQSFGVSYHASLRETSGAVSAGPPLRNTLLIGAATGSLVLITGIVLLFSPAPTELAVAMLLMSVFCAMRTVSSVFQVVLYTQRRDILRLTTNLGLVPVKLGLVAALASAGAVGAATATVITDAILLAIYATALYRKAKT
jgi:O-antigen/teichoic acid export membrane protein